MYLLKIKREFFVVGVGFVLFTATSNTPLINDFEYSIKMLFVFNFFMIFEAYNQYIQEYI